MRSRSSSLWAAVHALPGLTAALLPVPELPSAPRLGSKSVASGLSAALCSSMLQMSESASTSVCR